jgi:membrane protein
VLRLAEDVWTRINDHNLSLAAAGIAFWALLAMFPAIGVLLGLVALVYDPQVVSRELIAASGLLPPEAGAVVARAVDAALPDSGAPLTSAVLASLAFALWSARYAVSALMGALDTSFGVAETRSLVRQELVALALTFGAIVATIVALVVIAVLPLAGALLPQVLGRDVVMPLARWPLLAVLMVAGLSVLYRFGPSRAPAGWRLVTPGAIVATLLWLAGSVLFTVYVARFDYYSAMYGSLGAVVILLLWLWLSAFAVLTGAEIDAARNRRPATGV